MSTALQTLEEFVNTEYKYGFVSDIETEALPPGLNEDTIRAISARKCEPAFLLEWRLKAYRHWRQMTEPRWQKAVYPPINYQDIIYFAAPKTRKPLGSLDEVDPELRRTFENLRNACVACRRKIPNTVRILIEYKVFEPGTYSTTVPDWGAARMIAQAMGGNTGVLIDLGHHYPGTNIEQIVAMLIADGMPGGFHFNARYAADDDHAVEPSPQVARIFYELVEGGVIANRNRSRNWAYMIDQCSGRENRMRAVLHSVDSLQQSLAKAMLVDTAKLCALQDADRIIPANRLFNDALINCDVRPIVAKARLEKGLPVDPVVAYTESGYQERIERERG